MRLLLQSSRRFLYRHPGQLILALIGIAAGVAVVTGVALMRDVLVNALDTAAGELAGNETVRIQPASGTLDEDLYRELALTPAAPALVPVLAKRVRHDGQPLVLLGIDPLSLGGRDRPGLASQPVADMMQSANAIAITRSTLERLGLSRENNLFVEINGVRHELRIAAVIEAGGGLDDRLLMDIAAAQHLLDQRGKLSWIDAPAGSRAWLEQRVPADLMIRDAGQRRDSAARLTEGMRANLTAMSLLSLAVGLFVIFSVLSFLMMQRQRTFGMLRAVGVTQAQISRLLMIETLAISALGALLGLALGTLLANTLLGLVRQPVAELYRLLPPADVAPTPGLYAGIWLLTVIMAQASTAGIWREARRIPPGQLVRPAGRHVRRRHLDAIACISLAAGLVVIAVSDSLPAAFAGLFLGLAGCALLVPGAGLTIIALLRRPLARCLPGRALAMLSAGRHRIGPALSALSLALALTAGIGMMVLGFRGAVDDWIDRLLRADSYLTLSQGRIGAELAERVAAIDVIDTVSSARRMHLPDGTELIAYDLPEAAWSGFEWLAGDPEQARRRFLTGSAVLVSEPFARRHDKSVGDFLGLPAPGGEVTLEIAAVYRDYASDQGAISIHAPFYRRRWNDSVRDSLGLYFTEPPPERAQLLESLRRIDEHVVLTSREQVRRSTLAAFDRTFRISWALALLVGVIAIVALVSALLALGLERRREYATLRALGLTRGGLAGMVISQTASMATAAALVAVPLAIVIHLGLSSVVQPRAFGWSLPLSWPTVPLLVTVPLAMVVGVIAGIYPAWRIARRDPAPELKQD